MPAFIKQMNKEDKIKAINGFNLVFDDYQSALSTITVKKLSNLKTLSKPSKLE